MTPQTLGEYRRLRKLGWRVADAGRTARINRKFGHAEFCGLVRLVPRPDDEPYDPGDCELDEHDRDRRERDGVTGITAEFNTGRECTCNSDYSGDICKCGAWEIADSVWGFIGDDWKDSGYDADLRRAALDAYVGNFRANRPYLDLMRVTA